MSFPARARRARVQIFGLMSRRPSRPDYTPEELLQVVEAAALHAAAKGVLARLPVPPGLSAEARAGWRAARAAAVLALVAEAERTSPAPPPAPEVAAPSGSGVGGGWAGRTLDWSQIQTKT
ncbi:hypothetical protein K1Y80_34865 [Streptomyces sp. MAG02]|nr:hypothetical protein [Streptomyces sp. MAG02]